MSDEWAVVLDNRIAALEEALRHQLVVHTPAANGCSECDKGAALIVTRTTERREG